MKSKKGFSIVEIMSAAVLISTVALISAYQYQKVSKHSLKSEAKIQLGHLYQAEQGWFVENKTYTAVLNGRVAFPKGNLIYNVGFELNTPDFSRCEGRGGDSIPHEDHQVNNYWELCGNTYTAGKIVGESRRNKTRYQRSSCALRSIRDKPLLLLTHTQGKLTQDTTINKDGNLHKHNVPNAEAACKGKGPRGQHSYKKFVAYAIGDILKPDGSSPKEKKDIWRINQTGKLENCQNPLDDGSTSTCLLPMN